jgi:hypothetical protein
MGNIWEMSEKYMDSYQFFDVPHAQAHRLTNLPICQKIGILQGDPKVLDTFVFVIYSKSLGAQKKLYCQIKAEILKFMWLCEKSQFVPKMLSRHQNEKI